MMYLVTQDDRLRGSSVKVALTLQTRITNTKLLTSAGVLTRS